MLDTGKCIYSRHPEICERSWIYCVAMTAGNRSCVSALFDCRCKASPKSFKFHHLDCEFHVEDLSSDLLVSMFSGRSLECFDLKNPKSHMRANLLECFEFVSGSLADSV